MMFQMSELAFNFTFVVVVDNFPSDVQHLKKFKLLHFISVVKTWLNTMLVCVSQPLCQQVFSYGEYRVGVTDTVLVSSMFVCGRI